MSLCRALHKYGAPAHRIEYNMARARSLLCPHTQYTMHTQGEVERKSLPFVLLVRL